MGLLRVRNSGEWRCEGADGSAADCFAGRTRLVRGAAAGKPQVLQELERSVQAYGRAVPQGQDSSAGDAACDHARCGNCAGRTLISVSPPIKWRQMTFQITYRGADGARTEETVEAVSRAACLAQLKARGIAAVSVREGASGGGARRRWIVPVVLGGLGVAALALLLTFFAAREAPRPVAVPKAKPPVRPKVEKRPAARPPTPVTEIVVTNVVGKKNVSNVRSNVVIRPGFFKPTRTLEDGTVVDLRPPSAIKDPMERALAAIATPGGMAIPFAAALRRFSYQELMEMLARDVEFSSEDTEIVVEKKVAVQQVKEQFRAYMREGKTLDEAIREVDRQMRAESMQQAFAYKGLAEAVRTGDAKIVNQYVEEQNKTLQEQGLRLLSVPPQFRTESVPTETE